MIKKTRICPECHSEGIKEDWKLRGAFYECGNCGYRGVLILEIPINKLRKLKKKEKPKP